MIKIFFVCGLIALSLSSRAIGETLFRGHYDSGGFDALVVKASSFGSDTEMITGTRFGWIVNHSFIFGGGYYILTSTHSVPPVARKSYNNRELMMTLNYWGGA